MDKPINEPTPRSLFADDSAAPVPPDNSLRRPTPPVARPRSKALTRIVLPAAIFIIGIACIAWVTQYLPSRGRPVAQSKPASGSSDAIQFKPATFVWQPNELGEPKDRAYTIPEFELGKGGRYDYQFSNSSSGDVELGLSQISCTCSFVAVCVFRSTEDQTAYKSQNGNSETLNWTTLEVDGDMRKKVVIPAQVSGVLRIAWKGAKTEPELLRLNVKVWSRAGHGQDTRVKDLVVLANYVRPVKFFPEKVEFGTLGPKDQRKAGFVCWSATRDIDVKPAGEDKLIEVETMKLSPQQCQTLQKEMRAHNEMTRVLSAYKVTVTLFEENGGQQLDLGLFLKPIPLAITADGDSLDVPGPVLRANVLGDVTLGPEEQGERIDFNIFSAKTGKTKKVTLFSPKEAKLSFVGCDPVLLDLDAELKKVKTVGEKAQWQMEVTAKPNRDPGLLPENGVLVLRCDLPATAATPATKRLVRIHVIGTAERRH
jgi:hypothetical protein